MTELVPRDEIESIVGRDRHATEHYARAVSATQTVYIMHPEECLGLGWDLRDCPFSVALSKWGINPSEWEENVAMRVVLDKYSAMVPVPDLPVGLPPVCEIPACGCTGEAHA